MADGIRGAAESPASEAVVRPVVTITIPAFNAQATVERAIRSALEQRGASLEVVVVDDGSTDKTLELARRLACEDPRLRVLSQDNTGTAGALNAGISAASGDYIAALGADDELARDYLTLMTQFIAENPGYDIYSHDSWAVRADGSQSRILGWDQIRSVQLDDLLRECVILGGGTLVSRRLLESLGGYRQDMYNEDYDLWLRALAGGARHLYLPKPLYRYHLGPEGQKTGQAPEMYASAILMLQDLMERHVLSEEQKAAAEGTISRFHTYLEETRRLGGRTVGQLVEEYAEGERATVAHALERMMPEPWARRVLGVLRRSAWLVRPVRRLIWAVRIKGRNRATRDDS